MDYEHPRYVAFDIGNVLCHVHLNTFYDFLVTENVVSSKEQADEFLSGIQHPQDLGLYNIRQGFYRFNPNLPRKVLQDLHDVWLSIIQPVPEMLEVVTLAIEQKYNVALLSNIGFDHSGVIRQKCKVFHHCAQHFSCEVGARKPAKLFYQSFSWQYKWPANVMFFDDRLENISSASPFFKGIHFDLDDFESDALAAGTVKELLEIK